MLLSASDRIRLKAATPAIRNFKERALSGALNELNDVFRNYPQWQLEKWEVFRAWYKELIDHALENPEIYNLSMKDGSDYSKEKDPLYDPDAPDWELFDRNRYSDEEDDEEDDDDYDDDTPKGKTEAKDALMVGIGFGLANCIINGK